MCIKFTILIFLVSIVVQKSTAQSPTTELVGWNPMNGTTCGKTSKHFSVHHRNSKPIMMTTQNPRLKRRVKANIWKPEKDIKVFELAKCIRFVTNPICLDSSLIDPGCMRHFTITFI